jgi:hypothetical protein
MSEEVEVWVIPGRREVLVTEYPGPPAEICGYISKEARAAHQARGGPALVSEIGFPAELYLGTFPSAEGEGDGWWEAKKVAEAKAQELGYVVVYQPIQYDDEDDYEADLEDEYFNFDCAAVINPQTGEDVDASE